MSRLSSLTIRGSGTDERACASGSGKDASHHSIGLAPGGTSTPRLRLLASPNGAAFCNEAAVFQARERKTLPADLNGFRKLNGALPRV